MNTNLTRKQNELDNETSLKDILRGECQRIHVTGWDEVNEIEKERPLKFYRYDELEKLEEYYDNKYFCTTTEDGQLP
jgi:hypothetical protein